MASNRTPRNDATITAEPARSDEDPVWSVVKKVLAPLASPKLTMVLMGMAVFLVFAGTMAQAAEGAQLWEVVRTYFRNVFVWIDLDVFFPPSLFPTLPTIPGGFPFPGGWTIGIGMVLNLLAAHALRFKIRADGPRLAAGLAVVLPGVVATWWVIATGSNKEGFQGTPWLPWGVLWTMFLLGLSALWIAGVAGAAVVSPKYPSLPKRLKHLSICGAGLMLLMGGFLIWLWFQFLFAEGDAGRLGDSSMRILWQLVKATVAGLVLLGGAVLIFRKSGGVVLIHGAVVLLMFNELYVAKTVVERRLRFREGETVNHVFNIRKWEVAVIDATDPDEDVVGVIPIPKEEGLIPGDVYSDEALPLDVEVVEFFQHSDVRQLKPEEKTPNPADAGSGQHWIAEELKKGEYRLPSAYVKLYEKGESEPLGTYLITIHLNEQSFFVREQDGKIEEIDNERAFRANAPDGKIYRIDLRYKRSYRPWSMHLIETTRVNYPGTDKAKGYSSKVRLVDPDRDADRKILIEMNEPLRYAGETFYQADHDVDPLGREVSMLQVVANRSWMVPYVSCMIAMTGMLYHFALALVQFLRRLAAEAGSPVKDLTASLTTPTPADPTARRGWEIAAPAAVVALAAVLLCYAAIPPRTPKDGMQIHQFGKLPVMYEGRVKPFDTLARNSLQIISGKQSFKDADGKSQPAIRFLLDVIADPERAYKHPVFRIDNADVRNHFDLERRKGYRYAFDEFREHEDDIVDEAKKAYAKEPYQRDAYDRGMIDLREKVWMLEVLLEGFHEPDPGLDHGAAKLIAAVHRQDQHARRQPLLAVPPTGSEQKADPDLLWRSYTAAAGEIWVRQAARASAATTARELAEELVEDVTPDLQRQNAREIVREVRNAIAEHLEKAGNNESEAEAAARMAVRMPNHPYREIAVQIAGAKDGISDEQIAANLSDRTVEVLFDSNADTMFRRLAAMFPLEVVRRRAGEFAIVESFPTRENFDGCAVILFESAVQEVLGDRKLTEPVAPAAESLRGILHAYADNNVERFNENVAQYRAALIAPPRAGLSVARVDFETFFNNCSPFLSLSLLYRVVFLFTIVYWLLLPTGLSRPLRDTALWLTVFLLAAHTAALMARMYISGRPPVTDLYTSAVFIGWAGVVLGILLEIVFSMGIGCCISSVAGFSTLLIAHYLADDGKDTFKVMQAVLDTNFWLWVHVITIALGYMATFVAGVLGILYVFGNAVFSAVTPKKEGASEPGGLSDVAMTVFRILASMMFGVVCFAIFFNFVGTVTGGLWADDSWGRFWGWDPKENGALVIVLWNALVLHAYWSRLVRGRGLAVLSVAGNMVTAWSWFGVNQLGVGLHSYGFTDGAAWKLFLFAFSQILIIVVGLLPTRLWRRLGG